MDGFDAPRDDNNTDECSDSSVDPVVESHKRRRSDVNDDSHEETPPDKHEKAKSKRKNAVYSARLRAKKKNEMQHLKEQVTQLQMQLERLKKAKSLSASTAVTDSGQSRLLLALEVCRADSSCWLQEATAQAYRRQEAEQLNVQLKTLLAKVVARSRSMQDAFRNLQSLGLRD